MRKTFSYGRVNSVALLTDGRNEDKAGISLPSLLDNLRRDFDPLRPVRLITIAYGPDADAAVLKNLSDVTGAPSYVARDPRAVDQALRQALSTL